MIEVEGIISLFLIMIAGVYASKKKYLKKVCKLS